MFAHYSEQIDWEIANYGNLYSQRRVRDRLVRFGKESTARAVQGQINQRLVEEALLYSVYQTVY